ncbi:MAG: ribosome biogenesis GTPase Der [Spirochaetales bacterium]|nr:ribosome biogenesis GTPase Der [Spirochaetales bacterium]
MAYQSAEGTVPQVAIVGRPNVGKSTLFNRLVGRRRAITDPTPGVTRDPVGHRATLAGHEVQVVDTGGFTTGGDELARAISERALRAIDQSDVVLLVVDGTDLTALDEEFLEQLRPYGARLVLVVNKLDTDKRDDLVWEFHALGVDRVVGVSAAHGRGIQELGAAVHPLLDVQPNAGQADADGPAAAEADTDDEGDIIRLAILGQPNTGKSTLVNRLTASDNSLVSSQPGTTRDVIEGAFEWGSRRFYVLDTAGIRRKSKVTENIEYYSVNRAISTIKEAEVVVLLVDAEKGLTEQDKKISALVVEKGRGIILALSKWDVMPKIGNQFQAIRDRIDFLFPILRFAPLVPVSGLTGSGVDNVLDAVVKVRSQLHHRVETGKLNRHLAKWVEENPPPMRGRRRPKIKYMTQVDRLPVTFIAFVSNRRGIAESYVQYLRNRIRADFGLDKIPIRLELRHR